METGIKETPAGGGSVIDRPSSAVHSSSPSSEKTKRFDTKKLNAVAFWAWDLSVDTCAICRNLIMEHCIECQAIRDSETRNDCSVACGVCNHAFHFHCISRWLKTRHVCPLDNSQWEYQKIGN